MDATDSVAHFSPLERAVVVGDDEPHVGAALLLPKGERLEEIGIGEVGLNELDSAARTLAEVTAFGVDRACVVGASSGGNITTTQTLGAPDRVNRTVGRGASAAREARTLVC